jgi:hypothetical protein
MFPLKNAMLYAWVVTRQMSNIGRAVFTIPMICPAPVATPCIMNTTLQRNAGTEILL